MKAPITDHEFEPYIYRPVYCGYVYGDAYNNAMCGYEKSEHGAHDQMSYSDAIDVLTDILNQPRTTELWLTRHHVWAVNTHDALKTAIEALHRLEGLEK